MKSIKFRDIFFDLDHTLWDFDRNSELAFTAIFDLHGVQLELQEFLSVYMPLNLNYWKRYRENKVTKETLRLGRLRDTFEDLGYCVPEQKIKLLAEEYIRYLPRHNHLYEGVLETLEHLLPHYRLHIITNGFEEVQHEKLRASGIRSYFDTVTTSEEAGCKKPHRRIFELALEKAGASKDYSLMVGDDFEADIQGAKQVGMQAVYLNYKGEIADEGFPQITQMRQLWDFLKK